MNADETSVPAPILEQDIHSLKAFFETEFPQATLQGENQGILTFYIPLSSIKWSKIVGFMECNRDALNIEQNSISKPMLEESFLDFVKCQREDKMIIKSSDNEKRFLISKPATHNFLRIHTHEHHTRRRKSFKRLILILICAVCCAQDLYNNANQHINVYGDDVEVDYRGYEVTVENFVRLLTGRTQNGTARSKKLLTDAGSNVLIYLTGHGGDGFLKFQDSEEITSQELADAVEQMWEKKRYNELFLMVDTCQAASLYEKFTSPNILAVASSLVGEDSLSHHVDSSIGVYMIDRYTYYALEFLEKVQPNSDKPWESFNFYYMQLTVCPKRLCISTVGVRKDLYRRDPYKVPITDFFGSIRPTEIITDRVNITMAEEEDFIEAALEAEKNNAKIDSFYIQYEAQFPKEIFK
ncbi:hypothetical protein DOY81_011671 [Sarcophaga bullata]|nr:hypothetical protein DOY81_011671 [Sarcophaga bullata]